LLFILFSVLARRVSGSHVLFLLLRTHNELPTVPGRPGPISLGWLLYGGCPVCKYLEVCPSSDPGLHRTQALRNTRIKGPKLQSTRIPSHGHAFVLLIVRRNGESRTCGGKVARCVFLISRDGGNHLFAKKLVILPAADTLPLGASFLAAAAFFAGGGDPLLSTSSFFRGSLFGSARSDGLACDIVIAVLLLLLLLLLSLFLIMLLILIILIIRFALWRCTLH